MSKSSRYLALCAYLLLVVGALYVLLAQRRDAFAVYHAKQSLTIALAALLAPVAWAIAAWVLLWIPLAGPVIGASLFALLIAAYIGLVAGWVAGMVYALQGKARPVPLVGRWATRLPPAPAAEPAPVAKPIEGGTTIDA